MTRLYENIKKYREAREMSQETLAKLTGYTDRSSIAKIESGVVDLQQSKIELFAKALNVPVIELVGWDDDSNSRIPLYGRVAAGEPLEMIPEIKYMDNEYERNMGEYFALTIHGDSMAPDIQDGDTAIIHRQDDAESGDIVIATINGDEATCKRLRLLPDGIELIPNNPAYSPFEFSAEKVARMPVRIIGKVVEVRRKICG